MSPSIYENMIRVRPIPFLIWLELTDTFAYRFQRTLPVKNLSSPDEGREFKIDFKCMSYTIRVNLTFLFFLRCIFEHVI
jgi:hypothetical protein